MEPRKMVLMSLFAGQPWRNRCRKQTCGPRGRGEGRGWDVWRELRTLAWPYVKYPARGSCPMTQGTQATCQTPWQSGVVGWGRRCRREETWVHLWLSLVDIWQKTTKFCKAAILPLKNRVTKKKLAKFDPRETCCFLNTVHPLKSPSL